MCLALTYTCILTVLGQVHEENLDTNWRTLDSDVIMSTKTQNAVRIPIYLINEMQIIPAQRTIYKQMQIIRYLGGHLIIDSAIMI